MKYLPSYTVAEMVGISGHVLSKITASMMVLAGGQKTNIGLSLKFEAKGLKVIGYSRKNGRFWEFSEKAIELIKDYKVGWHPLLLITHAHCSLESISRGVPCGVARR